MRNWGYIFIMITLSFCSVFSISPAQGDQIEKFEVDQSQYEIHIVEEGEDLHLLAAIYYNNARLWDSIYEANKDTIKDPNLIHPGQRLAIPMYVEYEEVSWPAIDPQAD